MRSHKRFVTAALCSAAILALGACEGGKESDPKPAETTSKPAEKSSALPAPVTDAETDAKLTAAPAAKRIDGALADAGAKKPAARPAAASASTRPASIEATGAITAESIAEPAGDAHDVVLEPARLDLGEIPTNDSRAGVVRLTNTGSEPRTVLDCKTSCGCTTANCQKGKSLQPGETMEVEIKLSGGQRAVKLNKTVTFLVSDQPPLRLPVSGEAVSYVSVTPEKLDPELHPDGMLTLRAVDNEPFVIQSMYPPVVEEFSTVPAVEQVVYVSWDKLRERGHRSTKLLFTLSHPKCSKVNGTLAASAVAAAAPRTPTARPVPGAPDLDVLLQAGDSVAFLELLDTEKIKINEADDSGQTPLIKAARWGNAEVIQALLDASSDISIPDRVGRTPLMYACQAKSVEAVQVLLEGGADIHQRDEIGNTALCWAAGFGDVATVETIIEAGGDPNVTGPLMGFTPLIWASLSGEPDTITLLIENGADIESADVLQGATPLMHAVRTGGPANVKVLLDAGAKLESRDKSGNTPLLIAASNAGADVALVQLLVDAGADLNAKDKTGRSAVDLAEKRTDLRAAEVLALFKSLLGAEGN